MDPILGSALISGVAGLFGGSRDERAQRKAQDRQNIYNLPINVRARAEQGGFNPLLFAGNPASLQQNTNFQPMMGQAIANAGLQFSGAIVDKEQLKIEKSKLEVEKQKLAALIQEQTIKPKVGGIYSGNQKISATKKGADEEEEEKELPTHNADGTQIMSAAAQAEADRGNDPVLEDGRATVTTPYSANSGQYIDPRNPDAEMAEARYSDILSNWFGAKNIANDRMYTYLMQEMERKHGKRVALAIHYRYARETEKDIQTIMREEIANKKTTPKVRPESLVHKNKAVRDLPYINYPTAPTLQPNQPQ